MKENILLEFCFVEKKCVFLFQFCRNYFQILQTSMGHKIYFQSAPALERYKLLLGVVIITLKMQVKKSSAILYNWCHEIEFSSSLYIIIFTAYYFDNINSQKQILTPGTIQLGVTSPMSINLI